MVLSDVPCTFLQCSGRFPYVFFIAIHYFTLVTVDDIAFPVLGLLILTSDQQLHNGGTSLEVCLYPICAADLLEVIPQSLYIVYHFVACAWSALAGPDFCVCRVVRSSCWVIFLVVTILLPVVVNVLIFYFIYGPPGVFALCQGLPDLLLTPH